MADNMTVPDSLTVTVDCSANNGYTSDNLGARISSIFVILCGSMLGALLPIVLTRTRCMRVPKLAFFIAKYFGSGVIIATAFIHLLAPATNALQSPCLDGPISQYPWAEGIALMTTFVMFFIELMALRFQMFGNRDLHLEAADPAMDLLRGSRTRDDNGSEDTESGSSARINACALTNETEAKQPENADAIQKSVPAIPKLQGENHLSHAESHIDDKEFAAEMTALFILEFGVVFHSIFIGLTLAVAGEEFKILYIVLVFHQTFEGLGLGSRLATAQWPRAKRWVPWVLGALYGITTPAAIGVGIGVNQTFLPGSSQTLIVNGVFDSISAGILIYTGLVELMAHEFMFSQEMRRSSMSMMLFAFACMCLGAGLMALLGKWA